MKEREVRLMLKEYGLEVVKLVRNSHWKARVRRRDGSEKTVTFPSSHSDHRALKNKRAQLLNISTGAE